MNSQGKLTQMLSSLTLFGMRSLEATLTSTWSYKSLTLIYHLARFSLISSSNIKELFKSMTSSRLLRVNEWTEKERTKVLIKSQNCRSQESIWECSMNQIILKSPTHKRFSKKSSSNSKLTSRRSRILLHRKN